MRRRVVVFVLDPLRPAPCHTRLSIGTELGGDLVRDNDGNCERLCEELELLRLLGERMLPGSKTLQGPPPIKMGECCTNSGFRSKRGACAVSPAGRTRGAQGKRWNQ